MKSPRDAAFGLTRRSACVALGAVAMPRSWAQAAWPNKPLRVIVPFAGGGTIDAVARQVSALLGETLGQQVLIDNRPGANGVVGTEMVARAAPDGYTLLMVTGSFAVNPSVYRKLSYDVLNDFVPITSVARALGLVLAVHPALPVRNVSELVKLSKERDLSYSSPGIGNTTHLAMELFKLRTGARMVHVPYKGSAPALQALLSGEVQVEILPPAIAVPHIKAGRMRVIAFSGPNRLADMPDVPTMKEAGVDDMVFEGSWVGLFAPARTPKATTDRLYNEIAQILQRPQVRETISADGSGYLPDGRSPEEFARQVKADVVRFAEIVKVANISVE